MNLLEAAGFSRSNPYNIVKQGQVGGITWTYCAASGTLHGVLKRCAFIYIKDLPVVQISLVCCIGCYAGRSW